MHRSKNILVVFLILTCSGLAAQNIRGLQENPVLKKHLADHPNNLKSASQATSLSLPFFEDFSTTSVFPDPAKWTDQYVFINNSFGIDPMSFGVATLDAIDENGDVYSRSNWPASSDTLTSQEFDLSVIAYPAESVRLSFYYQCGGRGEVPELVDSLLLELYSPSTGKWERNWYASLNDRTTFQQEIINVPDKYYQDGFRFRFRNYTSLSVNDVSGGEGALSNADCWNIDYIQMNTAPASAHQSVNDIALIDAPQRMLDFYEIIPWLHLNNAQSITRNIMNYDIRNLQREGEQVNIGRNYYLKDLKTGYFETYEEFFELFGPDTVVRRKDPFYAPFTRKDDSEEGIIEVGSYLVTPAGQFKQNDTSSIILHFEDYYAYDDGIPEYGFGIEGPSMAGALLAYKFRVYKSDTLQALELLFNKARDNFNADLGFQLCVWKDGGGKPGDLIYMSPEISTPGIPSGLPDFKRIPFPSVEDLFITDTIIYVGWKQLTDEFLNLGYDVNRNNLDRTFINVSGEWFNPGGSLIPGTIMIRAAFGSKRIVTGHEELSETTTGPVLYPNPVSELLHIEPFGSGIHHISIVDMTGRMVLQYSGELYQIDVSSLTPGIYQVILSTGKSLTFNRKIVVRH